jgi:hypothetical protein
MVRGQVGATGLLAMLVVVGLVACGGGDEDDGDGDAPTRLTCDQRNIEGSAPICREYTIPKKDLSTHTDYCLEGGGDVLPGPCPSIGRVGCCEHVQQYPQRDCFYSSDFDDPGSCVGIYDGVWTPR